ncbi:MAG: hypothetical protein DMD43_09415 [Gemmatimonadetes bacterium]|nr:MAG: hypothetical protein DMD43_09415 [Gemmatimonadota bacterium]
MTISRPLLALAGALLIPQTLPAQACLAAPRTATGWIGARVARTSDHENLFGADAGGRITGAVTVRAQGDRMAFGDQTPTRYRGLIGVVVGRRSWSAPVCFTASARLTRLGDLSVVTLPIGIAAGWEVPFQGKGGGSSWTSYVEPRVAYRRATLKGFHDTSAPFSMVGGSGFNLGRVYAGADAEWSPSESHSWAVGLRAAVGF